MPGAAHTSFLHHGIGAVIWNGGVAGYLADWNTAHGTDYQMHDWNYPSGDLGPSPGGSYPWANLPYDYWNLWVNHTAQTDPPRDRGELNLDDIADIADVIVFKHGFEVSDLVDGPATGDVTSSVRTIANYQAQYQALRTRMRQFPGKRFILWTGPARIASETTPQAAERARQFFEWVRSTWDEPGDNIFLWDFRALETTGGDGGGLYLRTDYAGGGSTPNQAFADLAAPLLLRRVVDVIEGRGDTGSRTGQ